VKDYRTERGEILTSRQENLFRSTNLGENLTENFPGLFLKMVACGGTTFTYGLSSGGIFGVTFPAPGIVVQIVIISW
jgi:hypothetical protein